MRTAAAQAAGKVVAETRGLWRAGAVVMVRGTKGTTLQKVLLLVGYSRSCKGGRLGERGQAAISTGVVKSAAAVAALVAWIAAVPMLSASRATLEAAVLLRKPVKTAALAAAVAAASTRRRCLAL
jgi:hypothetical protein